MLALVPKQIMVLDSENMRAFFQRVHIFVRTNLPQQVHWTEAVINQKLISLMAALSDAPKLSERDVVTFFSVSLLYKTDTPEQQEAARYLAGRCAMPLGHVLKILEGL